jgi:hypothetical protein
MESNAGIRSGFSANVNAMARLGLLYLHEGAWNDRQIFPREFVAEVRHPGPELRGLPVRDSTEHGNAAAHYGLLWWNNADGTLEQVPPDTYWSWGLYDSLIVVAPSLEVVVARAGRSWPRQPGAPDYAVLKPFLQPIAEAASGSVTDARDLPANTPRPQSPVIEEIVWAPASSIIRLARGSDNWPLTWADDDALYSAYGDGSGFDPASNANLDARGRKLSLGVAKIRGAPPKISGENIHAPMVEAMATANTVAKRAGS